MAYKMKGFSGFKPETKSSPNKFLGKLMKTTKGGKFMSEAGLGMAFGPLGMVAQSQLKKWKGQREDKLAGREAAGPQFHPAQQGEIPVDAPVVTGTPEQAPMMKKGSPVRQDDVEHKDLWVSEEGQGPRKTPVGPISDAEKRKIRERIIDLEDRIEFISQDVDNDRVDRDKGFKRIRQFEAKIDELKKAIK